MITKGLVPMKLYALILAALLVVAPAGASVPKVGINGTLLNPSGSGPRNCTLKIQPSGAFSLDDLSGGSRHQMTGGVETFLVADSANVTLNIVPNSGKNNTPNNTYYDVTITTPGSPAVRQKWQIPWSATALRVADVVVVEPAPTITPGSLLLSGGTMLGAITLSGSPALIYTPIAEPTSPVTGSSYLDSTLLVVRTWNGSAWTSQSSLTVKKAGVTAQSDVTTVNLAAGFGATAGATGTVNVTASGGLGGASAYSNLRCKVTGTNTINVRADSISLSDGVDWKNYPTVNATLTISGSVGANGPSQSGADVANTWIGCYLIGKDDGTVATLGVTNTSAPVLPTGYTRSRLVSGSRNDASANLVGMNQSGPHVRTVYATNIVAAGGDAAFTVVDASSQIPPWSYTAMLKAERLSGADIVVQVRQDSQFDADPEYIFRTGTTNMSTVFFENLTDVQTFDYRTSSGTVKIAVLGYEMSRL